MIPLAVPRRAFRLVGFALILLVSPGLGRGMEDPAPAPGKPIALFDGKSLEGWKKTEFFKATDAQTVVEDGAIRLPVGRPMAGITSTRTDLPTIDYELIFEARRTTGDDFFAAATFPVGKSFITLVNGGWGGSVTGLSNLNGSNASENETNRFVKYQNGTWYRFRVQVTARVIRVWVDARELFAVNHEDVQVGTRIESRLSQPLGFATWKTAGAVRAITVRPLTPAEVEATNKAAKD